MQNIASVVKQAADIADEFQIDPRDFFSPREKGGGTAGTQIAQLVTSLADAAQVLNSSMPQEGEDGQYINVISPVVMPKDTRTVSWIMGAGFWAVLGVIGFAVLSVVGNSLNWYVFGPHYWILWLGYVAFSLWRNSFVEIPDGCQALITRFGKVEEIVGAGA